MVTVRASAKKLTAMISAPANKMIANQKNCRSESDDLVVVFIRRIELLLAIYETRIKA